MLYYLLYVWKWLICDNLYKLIKELAYKIYVFSQIIISWLHLFEHFQIHEKKMKSTHKIISDWVKDVRNNSQLFQQMQKHPQKANPAVSCFKKYLWSIFQTNVEL